MTSFIFQLQFCNRCRERKRPLIIHGLTFNIVIYFFVPRIDDYDAYCVKNQQRKRNVKRNVKVPLKDPPRPSFLLSLSPDLSSLITFSYDWHKVVTGYD